MEQEAADRLFEPDNSCPKCKRELIEKHSKKYGKYEWE